MIVPKFRILKHYFLTAPRHNGAYFITICTKDRQKVLSNIVGAIHESPVAQLTNYGKIVDHVIQKLPNRFGVEIDNYIIMPNHLHLIVTINQPMNMRAIHESPLHNRSVISKVIGYLKMNASKRIHGLGWQGDLWQRSFHDHIIRDEKDYQTIHQYITHNPQKWQEDCFYTQ